MKNLVVVLVGFGLFAGQGIFAEQDTNPFKKALSGVAQKNRTEMAKKAEAEAKKIAEAKKTAEGKKFFDSVSAMIGDPSFFQDTYNNISNEAIKIFEKVGTHEDGKKKRPVAEGPKKVKKAEVERPLDLISQKTQDRLKTLKATKEEQKISNVSKEDMPHVLSFLGNNGFDMRNYKGDGPYDIVVTYDNVKREFKPFLDISPKNYSKSYLEAQKENPEFNTINIDPSHKSSIIMSRMIKVIK